MKSSVALIVALVGFSCARPAQQDDDDSLLQQCKDDICSPLTDKGNIDACAELCTTLIQLSDGLNKENDEERRESVETSLKTFVDTVQGSGAEDDIQAITDLGLVGNVESEVESS